MKKLTLTKKLEIRFSEVDAMKVVWHGSYMLYFEDAREAFGRKYGLGYTDYMDNHLFAPVVEMKFNFKSIIQYGMEPEIEITYRPCEEAKILFDYKIFDRESGTIFATGKSVQVFMNDKYELLWTSPEFYTKWKERWNMSI